MDGARRGHTVWWAGSYQVRVWAVRLVLFGLLGSIVEPRWALLIRAELFAPLSSHTTAMAPTG